MLGSKRKEIKRIKRVMEDTKKIRQQHIRQIRKAFESGKPNYMTISNSVTYANALEDVVAMYEQREPEHISMRDFEVSREGRTAVTGVRVKRGE